MFNDWAATQKSSSYLDKAGLLTAGETSVVLKDKDNRCFILIYYIKRPKLCSNPNFLASFGSCWSALGPLSSSLVWEKFCSLFKAHFLWANLNSDWLSTINKKHEQQIGGVSVPMSRAVCLLGICVLTGVIELNVGKTVDCFQVEIHSHLVLRAAFVPVEWCMFNWVKVNCSKMWPTDAFSYSFSLKSR